MASGTKSNASAKNSKNFARIVEDIAVEAVRREVSLGDVGMVFDCTNSEHKVLREKGYVCVKIKDAVDQSDGKPREGQGEIELHTVPVLGEWAGDLKKASEDKTGSGTTRTLLPGTQVAISYRAGNLGAPYVNGIFYNPHDDPDEPNENQPAVHKVPLDKPYYAVRLGGGKVGINDKGRIDVKSVGNDAAKPTVGMVVDADKQEVFIGGEEGPLKYEDFEKESGSEIANEHERPEEERTAIRINAKDSVIEVYTTNDRKVVIDDKGESISIINSKDKEEINSVVIKEDSITLAYAEGEPELTIKKNKDMEFTGKNVTFTCDRFMVKPNTGQGLMVVQHDIVKLESSKTFLHKGAMMMNNAVGATIPVPGYGAPTAGAMNASGAFV